MFCLSFQKFMKMVDDKGRDDSVENGLKKFYEVKDDSYIFTFDLGDCVDGVEGKKDKLNYIYRIAQQKNFTLTTSQQRQFCLAFNEGKNVRILAFFIEVSQSTMLYIYDFKYLSTSATPITVFRINDLISDATFDKSPLSSVCQHSNPSWIIPTFMLPTSRGLVDSQTEFEMERLIHILRVFILYLQTHDNEQVLPSGDGIYSCNESLGTVSDEEELAAMMLLIACVSRNKRETVTVCNNYKDFLLACERHEMGFYKRLCRHNPEYNDCGSMSAICRKVEQTWYAFAEYYSSTDVRLNMPNAVVSLINLMAFEDDE